MKKLQTVEISFLEKFCVHLVQVLLRVVAKGENHWDYQEKIVEVLSEVL